MNSTGLMADGPCYSITMTMLRLPFGPHYILQNKKTQTAIHPRLASIIYMLAEADALSYVNIQSSGQNIIIFSTQQFHFLEILFTQV